MGNDRSVLVVEDEWLLAESLAAELRREGYSVVGPASSVQASLKLLADIPVDAAILDVTLCEEKSFPIAEELERRGVPYMFVSGHTERDLPSRFAGKSLLSKPVPQGLLKAALRAMLASVADPPPRSPG